MKILLVIACLVLCTFAYADEYKLSSSFGDIYPNDGIFEAGDSTNPYEITDEDGDVVMTMESEYWDAYPEDGIFDAGTPSNPYVIKTK